jgi:hypothetical protein
MFPKIMFENFGLDGCMSYFGTLDWLMGGGFSSISLMSIKTFNFAL